MPNLTFASVQRAYMPIEFLAFLVSATPADVPPDVLLAKLAVHAAAVAAFIRLAVRFLRSPLAAIVWVKVPVAARPAVLVALGLIAAVFDHVALGSSFQEALFAALGGVMGAVSSHEIQQRVKPPKARLPAVAPVNVTKIPPSAPSA